jgi:hypothetical protein
VNDKANVFIGVKVVKEDSISQSVAEWNDVTHLVLLDIQKRLNDIYKSLHDLGYEVVKVKGDFFDDLDDSL